MKHPCALWRQRAAAFAQLGMVLAFVTTALAVPAAAQTITVYSSGSVAIGQTRQLSAYVPLSPATITWTVNGVAGGNATYGTITVTGQYTATYTAPATVPAANGVKVRATSTAYPTKFGDVTMTVTQPVPQLWSISPTSVPVGPFTITLNGANYSSNSVVNLGGVPITTTLLSSTGLKATGATTASQAGTTIPITVTNTGLGGVTTAPVQLKIVAAPPVTVTVAPSSVGVPVSTTRQFSASVTGSTNVAVAWSVNGIAGGSAATGTISPSGLYTAPAAIPSPSQVAIQATSAANPSSIGSAVVTVQPPPPPPVTVSVAPSSATIAPSATFQFGATVTGNSNTAVTWSVNGIVGGNATVGTITPAGLYAAPSVIPNPAQISVRAASVANPNSSGASAVSIVGPPSPGSGQGTPNLSAARFLEQAAFGPTAADIAHVQQVGVNAWLNEQFALPETAINNPGSNTGVVAQEYLNRLSAAPDQLRQRVASALSQIIVISMNKNIYSDEIVPYLQILSHNAFGNYRQLMWDISTSSQMGKYLDLANSNKPSAGSGANENYARELMQLFTIGLVKLNPDGSSTGVPTYSQAEMQQVALALTGWTYPGPNNNNWENFSGPLQPKDVNHDMRQKSFLGCTLAAGQTTVQDMNGVLDCLFQHPNMGPFVATRLIRSMVTSNPSPGYIQRIATVFNNNGSGVRGDLQAVVRAILTDAEARNDAATQTSGRLKDPIYHIVEFTRALNGWIAPSNGLPWEFSLTAQTPLTPPSVFSFYSPMYRIPKTSLVGPEFQIYSPTEAVERGNFIWQIISNPGSDFAVTLTPFANAAGNIPQLIDTVDQTLLYGRMPAAMRQSLANAIAAQSDNTSRWQTALYLTALSGLYAVQY